MRGEIENRERARQLRDFSGLRWGAITPTDIDGFVEFGGKLFVWIEAKYQDATLPDGQRLALERVCDGVTSKERAAAVLIIEHDSPPDKDIYFATCQVREYRWHSTWYEPTEPITCKEAIDKLRKVAGIPL